MIFALNIKKELNEINVSKKDFNDNDFYSKLACRTVELLYFLSELPLYVSVYQESLPAFKILLCNEPSSYEVKTIENEALIGIGHGNNSTPITFKAIIRNDDFSIRFSNPVYENTLIFIKIT